MVELMKSVLLKNTTFQELFIHRLDCLIHNGTNKSFVWFYSRKLISFNSGFFCWSSSEGKLPKFKLGKRYLSEYWSDEGFQGTIVNRAFKCRFNLNVIDSPFKGNVGVIISDSLSTWSWNRDQNIKQIILEIW